MIDGFKRITHDEFMVYRTSLFKPRVEGSLDFQLLSCPSPYPGQAIQTRYFYRGSPAQSLAFVIHHADILSSPEGDEYWIPE